MVLSKRERYIGIATGLVVGFLVLLKVVIDPLWDQHVVLTGQIAGAEADLKKDNDTIVNGQRAAERWTSLAGQIRKDSSEAESQVLHNVRDWASEARINLASIKPERTEKEKDFQKLTFRATATGGMAQVGRFLNHIQTAEMPIRITDLTISSRKDGTDDLSLSVAIATIYLPSTEAPPRPGGAGGAGGGVAAGPTGVMQ